MTSLYPTLGPDPLGLQLREKREREGEREHERVIGVVPENKKRGEEKVCGILKRESCRNTEQS